MYPGRPSRLCGPPSPEPDLSHRPSHQVQERQADQRGEGPKIPRGKDDAQGREEHLRAHGEVGGGVQALDLRRDPGRRQPHPPLRPDRQQDRAGAEQDPLGASWHYLVMQEQLRIG